MPDLALGVAVLTNQESGEAFSAITFQVMDAFMLPAGAARTDWLGAYKKLHDRNVLQVQTTEQKASTTRNAESRPSLPLDRYAGTYQDAWYGDIAIALENGKLVMRFTKTPVLVGELEHYQYDTFIARWRDRELRADAYVTFALNPDGTIDRARMQAVSPATDFSFDFQDLLLVPKKGK